MRIEESATGAYRPLLLDESDPADAVRISELRADGRIEFTDLRDLLRGEFADLPSPPELSEGPEADRWVYYPWRSAVIALPGAEIMRAVRLDRNRNKITRAEQEILARQTIGIVGQSVGHTIAYTLAMEGICGRLRLADFDTVELTNLNRLPGGLFDLGVNKAVVAARRIAELDPYLPVEVFADGVHDDNMDAFLDGLSIVVEECDSLDVKLAVREAARRHRLPLLMETSDRGLLDVERFDLEPDRRPFHGVLGDFGAAQLRGLSPKEKAPFVIRILDAARLSDRTAASMVEIGETLASWPQLAGDVQLGGATVAAAVRRIGLGVKLPSGRTRVDVDRQLDEIAEPVPAGDPVWPPDPVAEPAPADAAAAVLHYAQLAPSGGNAQPWTLGADAGTVTIALDPSRSSAIDIGFRGSALAVGAALYNARVAAAHHGVLGDSELRADGPGVLTATLRLGDSTDSVLARDYTALATRHTNRKLGAVGSADPAILAALAEVAAAAGGGLRHVATRAGIESAADLLGSSDRARFLTPRIHEEMLAELRGPADDLRTGLDMRSMELGPDENIAFEVGGRPDVVGLLRDWSAGAGLGAYTSDRVLASAAIAAVTFPTPAAGTSDLIAYARAGEVLQRVWIEAERRGLAVQPVSPVFLFARQSAELYAVSPGFADTLTSLQGSFLDLLGVPEQETVALVLRLSHAPKASVRSRRLPIPGARAHS
ncbi:Rv1355c family protein [Nocardia sp. NPDC005746]|uniref:Rv1355c family protein n=1 Tax=Nocardia sp. NPDC005746 TaxID=3157062 RepID=UPI0033E46DE4